MKGRYLSAHTVAVTDGKLKSGLMREDEACSQEISPGKLSHKEESGEPIETIGEGRDSAGRVLPCKCENLSLDSQEPT